MDLENQFAAANVRQRHDDLAIESSRSQQRGIQNIRTVGCRNNNNPLIAFKTVHFDQHLVQRLLAFVVSTTQPGATMTPNSIQFVNKDNAGCLLLCLIEHVANARRAHSDEHLDEIGTRNCKERHTGFARYRLSK